VYYFHYILESRLSTVSFQKSNTILFRAFQAFQKRWNCREMGNSARVIVTKTQRLVATIVIRRRNIEWNKIAINAKHQTIRRRNKHISRRQSGAREIGAPRIPK